MIAVDLADTIVAAAGQVVQEDWTKSMRAVRTELVVGSAADSQVSREGLERRVRSDQMKVFVRDNWRTVSDQVGHRTKIGD